MNTLHKHRHQCTPLFKSLRAIRVKTLPFHSLPMHIDTTIHTQITRPLTRVVSIVGTETTGSQIAPNKGAIAPDEVECGGVTKTGDMDGAQPLIIGRIPPMSLPRKPKLPVPLCSNKERQARQGRLQEFRLIGQGMHLTIQDHATLFITNSRAARGMFPPW